MKSIALGLILLVSSCSVINKNKLYTSLSNDRWVMDSDSVVSLSLFLKDNLIRQKAGEETNSLVITKIKIDKNSPGNYATFETYYYIKNEPDEKKENNWFLFDYDFENSITVTDHDGRMYTYTRKK